MKKRTQKKKSNNLLPIILISAGTVLVLVVLALQLARPSGTAQNPPQNAANIPEPGIVRVPLDEAKQALDDGTAVIVDVRSADSYAASHIAGAVSIPFDQLEARIGELDPNQWIITYCT